MIRIFTFLLFLFPFTTSFSQSLSPLAPPPQWSSLEKYQNTITHQKFIDLLDKIYVTDGSWRKWITVTSRRAQIVTHKGKPPFILQFAVHAKKAEPVPRTWKSRSYLAKLQSASKPLKGLHIALDPGHLGGKWAIMEERYFEAGKGIPIKEGDMTLKVAKILEVRLKALGATVTCTRTAAGPTTSYRPQKLRTLAIAELRKKKMCATAYAIQKKSEELFYRTAEIRHRAWMINEDIHPDLVLSLHFNAEEWGGTNFELSPKNHLHLLVTGALSEDEFSKEDQRLDILLKLLNRTSSAEIPVAKALSKSLAFHTDLPPYLYKGKNVIRLSTYVWARNLLATRLYHCPVIFIEPYVMNNPKVVQRVQAGDYLGKKKLPGSATPQKSIYREYADGIVDGLVQYYSQK